jgi:N utilization substance protein B
MMTTNRPRHQARALALQGLYQLDIQRSDDSSDREAVLQPLLEEEAASKETVSYARELIDGAWVGRERYDQLITGVSEHWDVARMAVVDRNILRIALYEMIERPDVPVRVLMDEAIELGREFGAGETAQFINGVLDAVWRNAEVCRVARPEAEQAGQLRVES